MHDVSHIHPFVYQKTTEDVVAGGIDNFATRALKRECIVFKEGPELVAVDASSAGTIEGLNRFVERWCLCALSTRNEVR